MTPAGVQHARAGSGEHPSTHDHPHVGLTVAVVMAAPYPALQGSQVLVRQLAEGLAGRGHRVHLVAYGAPSSDLSSPVTVHGVPRLWGCRITASGPHPGKLLLDTLLTVRLLGIVRREGVDMIHAHNYEAAIASLVVGRLTARPVVYHGHSAMADELPTYFAGAWTRAAARRIGGWLDRHVPCRADYCIGVTTELVRVLQARGVRTTGVEWVVPGGLDLEPVTGVPDGVGRQAHGVGGAVQATLLYAGNLDRYQNLEFLLRAFVRVRAARSHVRLLVVTHGEGRRYQRRARELGGDGVSVIRVRTFSEARALIGAADVVVCPRTEETGFPMKVLNYMAAGKAIVACEGSAKLLQDGVTALVVPNGDEKAFARAIVALLDDPPARVRLGRDAQDAVRRLCASDSTLDRVEDIYRRILELRRSRSGSRLVVRPQPHTRLE